MQNHRLTYIDSIADSQSLSIVIIIIYDTRCKFTDIIVYYRKRIVLCVCVHIYLYIFMAVLVIYFSTGHYIIIKRVLLSSVGGCVCACPYKYYIYVRYGGGCLKSVMIMLSNPLPHEVAIFTISLSSSDVNRKVRRWTVF